MAADTGSDAKLQAAFALHRFGLGPREGSLAAIAADPRGALIADLAQAGRRAPERSRSPHQRRSRPRGVRFSPGAQGGAPRRPRRAGRRQGGCRAGGRSRAPIRRRRPIRPQTTRWRTEPGRRWSAVLAPPNPIRDARCPSRSFSRKPRPGSMPRSPRRSALPSGWRGSGPITSASRRTRVRCAPSSAPMSARRSGRMWRAASPTCCWRWKAIRACSSISTMRARSARIRSPAAIAARASTRTSPARSWNFIRWGCARSTPRTT